MPIPHHFFLDEQSVFPKPAEALDEFDGLIAVGGDLSSHRLLSAYKRGIFPWYNDGEPILWYHPNPRMVINQDSLKISKSLRKIIKQEKFDIKVNQNFPAVIHQCATINRDHQDGTWITNEMQNAYIKLHYEKYAHCVEVYQHQQLVGGLYGVGIGRMFFGESMFSKVSNASKVALVYLLKQMPYQFVDCQVENQHLKSLGAFMMSRDEFMKRLKHLIR